MSEKVGSFIPRVKLPNRSQLQPSVKDDIDDIEIVGIEDQELKNEIIRMATQLVANSVADSYCVAIRHVVYTLLGEKLKYRGFSKKDGKTVLEFENIEKEQDR